MSDVSRKGLSIKGEYLVSSLGQMSANSWLFPEGKMLNFKLHAFLSISYLRGLSNISWKNMKKTWRFPEIFGDGIWNVTRELKVIAENIW